MNIVSKTVLATACALPLFLSACSSNNSETTVSQESLNDFELNFKAVFGDQELNCNDLYTNIGSDGSYSMGVSDFRLYVSNLELLDADGTALEYTLEDNDFQLNHEDGSVALIDFLGKDGGYCDLASEGTERVNTQLIGSVAGTVAAVKFDVGVPQAVMKSVIAATDNVADAPSPLSEMYWSWASGYRHFVLNFNAMDATHTEQTENGAFHIGSRDCGTADKALAEQDTCGLVNTPQVSIENFDISTDSVTVDLAAAFANATESDFISVKWEQYADDESICIDERRNDGWCVTGESFGPQCHSSATQAACATLFPNFGLNLTDGTADASSNRVFVQ